MELSKKTLKRAAGGVGEKRFSARELIEDVLTSIKKQDENLHAYLEVYEEDALKAAVDIDSRIAAGDTLGPLMGVPVAVKDNILVKGKRISAASKMLEPYTASYNATIVEKLKKAGAIILGRTNMDEFAMGSSTESSAFGVTKNPHDTKRVPGGSSGGSAAAVAAHECIAALGSDTGGSIRQPASFCGIVGLKPTYGRVSRHGLIAMASSLDQIGPMTKTVEDARILFDVIRGRDPLDSTTVDSSHMEHGAYSKGGVRIGVPKEYFAKGINLEVKKSVENAIRSLHDMGYVIRDVSLPHADYALACYYIIMPAEVSANLARFDGIRYGLSEKGDNLLDVYTKTRHKGFGDEVRRRLLLGTYVLSAGYFDAYYTQAQKVRMLIRQDFERAFEEVDVILSPTAPSPAFKIGEKTKDPLEMYLEDIYTVSANIAGVPALSVPCGKTEAGLPIGLQLIGRWFEEETLFRIGEDWEKISKE